MVNQDVSLCDSKAFYYNTFSSPSSYCSTSRSGIKENPFMPPPKTFRSQFHHISTLQLHPERDTGLNIRLTRYSIDPQLQHSECMFLFSIAVSIMPFCRPFSWHYEIIQLFGEKRPCPKIHLCPMYRPINFFFLSSSNFQPLVEAAESSTVLSSTITSWNLRMLPAFTKEDMEKV